MGTGKPFGVSAAFQRLATRAAHLMGTHWAFGAALLLIAGWLLTGPVFDFNATWQLVINTATTIVTFLMVFLVQSTQNRDSKAIHLKLDELIRTSKARNVFADLENASDEELEVFQREFEELRAKGLKPAAAATRAHEASHKGRGHRG